MAYSIDRKRVVCICGSGGCGKTTLLEDVLFVTKKTTRKGSVERGNTVSDFDSEEIDRNVSLQLSLAYTDWKKYLVYFIDTPGYHNFIADTICGIRVADAGIMLVDAKEGSKDQTERLFDELQRYPKPVLFFINGIDKEDADVYAAFDSIRENVTAKAFLTYIPMVDSGNIKGFIDVLHKKGIDLSGRAVEVPRELEDRVEELNMALIEEISTYNDELMEKYLEGEELDETMVNETLSQAIADAKIFPVLVGSALHGIGTSVLLDSIVKLLPPPKEEYDGNVALVFKTYNDPQMGRLSLMRVYSGAFESDAVYYNVNKEQEERFGTLQRLQGRNLEKIEKAEAGDIFGVAKLKVTQTGDTMSDKGSAVKLDFPKMPLPFLSYALYGTSKENEEKIGAAISKIMESDPSLSFDRNNDTKEFILTGMGKTHLEVVASKLKKKFGVEVELKLPKVAYRETIKGRTKSHGRYKKQTGGHGQFGDCVIEIEPLPRGEGFEFVDMIVGGAIPKQFIPSVEKGIKMAMEKGILAGYPMTDIKIKLVDGVHHPVDSSDFSFQMAGSIAFKEGVVKCKPVLLEPILRMEIYVPESSVGDVMGDINSRRGRVLGIEPVEGKKKFKVIRALIPEMEVLEYAPTLRSLTGGRGYFKKEFDSYEEVPSQIAQRVIEESKEEGKA